jgi:hypothetical protein
VAVVTEAVRVNRVDPQDDATMRTWDDVVRQGSEWELPV